MFTCGEELLCSWYRLQEVMIGACADISGAFKSMVRMVVMRGSNSLEEVAHMFSKAKLPTNTFEKFVRFFNTAPSLPRQIFRLTWNVWFRRHTSSVGSRFKERKIILCH